VEYNKLLTRVVTRIDRIESELAEHERLWRLVTGQSDTGQLNRKAFYLDILATMFSADELRTLCFEMAADYDSLPGAGKFGKARELMIYLENRGRLDRLYVAVRRERPFFFEDRNHETGD
jgi:hypothetical protein